MLFLFSEDRHDGAVVGGFDELAAGLAREGGDEGLGLVGVLLAGADGQDVRVGLRGVGLGALAVRPACRA